MRLRRAKVLATLACLLTGGANAGGGPAPIERVGATEKVCQLTGETDWQSGKPTATRTLSRFGLDATDLGYPIEHDGELILMFGDTWPPRHPAPALEDAVPGDAVGVTTREKPPSDDGLCLEMRVNVEREQPSVFAPATVIGPPDVPQGFFNVPTGGISVGRRIYAFFWTRHCATPQDLAPAPEAPLRLPSPSAACAESESRNSLGEGVIAQSDDGARTFEHPVRTPPGFIYATAVRAPKSQNGGAPSEDIYILGAPRYRASVPYLAKARAETLSDPSAWLYFVGFDAHNEAEWVSYRAWAGGVAATAQPSPEWRPPGSPEIFSTNVDSEACVGEFSLTFNQPLGEWLLLYNCRGEIEARVAAAPWGPWSEPIAILGPGDGVACRWLMSVGGCGDRRDFWPSRRTQGRIEPGGFYAPFVLDRYTSADQSAGRGAVIYWLVSTWNPYEVLVLRTRLKAPG